MSAAAPTSSTPAGEAPPPSPLAGPALRCGLALVAAALVVKLGSTGGGIELLQPGVQVLFDALALCGVLVVALARGLGQRPPLALSGWTLLLWVPWVALLCAGAARASFPDLAWRTALGWSALPLLALSARDLGAERSAACWLVGLLLALVGAGALLGCYQYWVEVPQLIAQFERGELAQELAVQDPSTRQAFVERLHSRQATGPFLLPGLLASACCAALPLTLLAAWRQRRGALGLGCALAAGLLLLGLWFSKSKGGVVVGAGVGALLAALHPRQAGRRRRLLLVGAALALLGGVGVVALALGPERVGVGLSLTVRLEYWEAALQVAREAPLLGQGPNQLREFFPAAKSLRAEEALHAHSLVLQVLAELGLVGLLALAALFAAALRDAWPSLAPADPAAQERRAARDEGAPTDAEPAATGLGGERGVAAAVLAGLALGGLLLAAFGDCYNAGTPGHLLALALATGALTPLLARGLSGLSGPVLAAGCLAGASALLWDGLLDFGFHHVGLSTLCWLLLGLAPALGGVRPERRNPALLRALLLVPAGALALWLLLAVVPGALDAEQARDAGRRAREAALIAGQEGRADEALRQAAAAVEHFAAACELYPGDPRTWMQQAGALGHLARLSRDPARRRELWEAALERSEQALRRAPRGHDAHFLRAELLRESGRWDAASESYARAIELYPGHPEYLFRAGELLVAPPARAGAFDLERRRRQAEGEALLRRAREASATTRLVRRRLRPEQLERLERLLGE